MPNIFDHIKKAFHKPPLANEDWLEPSDQILSNIKAAIGDVDKKNRSPIVFYFLISLLVGSTLVLIFFNPIHQKNLTENQTQYEEIELSKTEANETSQTNAEFDKDSNSYLSVSNTPQIVDADIESKDKIQMANKVAIEKNLIRGGKQNLDFINGSYKLKINNQDTITSSQSSTDHNDYTQSADIIYIENEQISQHAAFNISITSNLETPINEAWNLTAELIPAVSINKLVKEEFIFPTLQVNKLSNLNIQSITPHFYIEAGVGVTFWNFRMNDDYKILVEPANFKKTGGVGYVTSIAVGKNLNPRFSLSLNGNYESIEFSSEHNSAIVYDNNLNQQTENITMATPLGLVNNQVALSRTADNSSDHTNLLVDLENEHQLTAVEFSANANISLVKNNKFSLIVSPGFGVQQILSTENKLTSLNTHNADIHDGGSLIEGSFENVKSINPFTSMQISAQRDLSDHWQISLRLGSSYQLSHIQETQDLKTNVIRYNTQLVLRRNF